MIDLSKYREASFRGIPFHVDSSQRKSGHRVDVKEYPFQSEGLVTDMGRKDDRFDLSIYLLGDDVLERRIDLEEAFNKIGSGPLVHPTRGELNVQVVDVSDNEKFTELGVADFKVSFVRSNKEVTPRKTLNTQKVVEETALGTKAAISNSYGVLIPASFPGQSSNLLNEIGNFDIKNTVFADTLEDLKEAFVEVGQLLQNGTAILNNNRFSVENINIPLIKALDDIVGDTLDLVVPVIREFDNLVGDAVKFSQAAVAIVEHYHHLLRNPREVLLALVAHLAPNSSELWKIIFSKDGSSYQRLLQRPIKDEKSGKFSGATPAEEDAKSKNTTVIAQVFFDAAAIEAARLSSQIEFSDLNEAVSIRDAIGHALSESITAKTISDPVKLAARRSALRNLRTAVFRDITERATRLPKLEVFTPSATESARVIAYRQSGDVAEQANLVARNRIIHPSFVPTREIFYLGETADV
ncbi:DNA circularization protein [Kiloniella majae]|uniref:DNA circularization protein n=1 Tax=Kiloniella majae TaxID=1938558 RepID=UPI000A27720D|nr:DNA circularization N-terminal domain-containing protein [Kiloniella majae]